jgi:Uma2 family endonuclease
VPLHRILKREALRLSERIQEEGGEARFDLVDGVVVELDDGPAHRGHAVVLSRWLARLVPEHDLLPNQSLLLDSSESVIVPDVSVCRRDELDGPLLVVEVAVTTPRFASTQAARHSSPREGVPELRVVDVERRAVHVHRGPSGDGWASIEVVTEGALQPAFVPVEPLVLESLLA